MKRLFLLVVFGMLFAMGGCATQSAGGSVDYASLVTNTCNVATAEITALQTVATELSTDDQTALAKVSPLITTTCAALSTNPQDTWVTLATLIPALTIIYVNNKTRVQTTAVGAITVQ